MNTFKTTIDGKKVIADHNLAGFTLFKRASSYVDYFGISNGNPNPDAKVGQIFFQFNNGTCFVFSEVPVQVLSNAIESDSIGKFYHAEIKGKYESQQVSIGKPAIMPDVDDDEDIEDNNDTDDPAYFGDRY